MPINELKLAKDLIRRPSVTPKDAGVISLLAKNFKLRGTPGFIINKKIFRGYVDYQNLNNIITNLRM